MSNILVYDTKITKTPIICQPDYLKGTTYDTANVDSRLGTEIINGKHKMFYVLPTKSINTNGKIPCVLHYGLIFKVNCEVNNVQEIIYLLDKLNRINWFNKIVYWLFFKLKKK